MMRYLIPLCGSGGCYPVMMGVGSNLIKRIKHKDPKAIIHFSGVSSGAICSLLFLISEIHNKNITSIHNEFISSVNKRLKQIDCNFCHYRKNEIYFDSSEEIIRRHIKNTSDINGKLYIGYNVFSWCHGLEFKVVSDFKDVDDLMGAIRASSHFSFLLKSSSHYMYRGEKCIDGFFIHNNFLVPGYNNVVIAPKVFDNVPYNDMMLNHSDEKYNRLYKIGYDGQKHTDLEFVVVDNLPNTQKTILKYYWRILLLTIAVLFFCTLD